MHFLPLLRSLWQETSDLPGRHAGREPKATGAKPSPAFLVQLTPCGHGTGWLSRGAPPNPERQQTILF